MRIPTVSLSFAAITMLVLGCLPLQDMAAQQPAGDKSTPSFRVQGREVLLPVTVRDKKGALVSDLTAADFTLNEDNRAQTIKSFSKDSNLPFILGLVVDTSQPMSSALDTERHAAEKFVQLMLPADAKNAKVGDRAFLIHFDREVELLEDITNSREKLNRELEQMGPSQRERNNPQGPETRDDSGGLGGWGGQRGGRGQEGEPSRGNRVAGTQLYDAIYLASDEVMKPENGRKALVVFSDGVDRGSKETLSEALNAAEHANVSVYTIYFKGETDHSFSFPGEQRGGMGGGYPGGGGRGGGGGNSKRETGVDGKKILEQIAARTGGRMFEAKKKENLEDIYNQIAQELRGQYLLSYTPDQVDNDGGYHKIMLKAKRDDVAVVTRVGYYAPGGDSR